jgi:formamidopyrimidine-DNA glycosylase
MAIKSFTDFVNEELDHVRHKKVKHVEDHNPEDGKNKEAEDAAKEYLEDVEEECPRCGEHVEDCQCEEDDP